MPRPSRRSDIIQTAIALFSKHGFNGTGVDMIMREAKVSKKTMYSYFRSKDELILASLQEYDGLFRNHFMKQVDKLAKQPDDKLLALFDVARAWFMQDHFFGCMFINAIGEYSDSGTPLRHVCRQFKTQMRGFIREICVQAGIKKPDELADELALLLEGAIVTAQVSQRPQAAEIAKKAAKALIAAHQAESSS